MNTKRRIREGGDINKIKYWIDKLPELRRNIEPLTLLMIRTAGEVNNYINNHNKSFVKMIVNSNNINLLHSIDRETSIKKTLNRAKFLKTNKKDLKSLEKKNGFIDLTSSFFLNSPFASINQEQIVELSKNKYVTISGVGRIAAIKMAFPEGIKLQMKVGKIDDCLKKRLIAINNLYIYGNRFANLYKYGIQEKEIMYCKHINTKKCYRRGKFLTKRTKKFKLIPYLGGKEL
jgi:hypothetical protein